MKIRLWALSAILLGLSATTRGSNLAFSPVTFVDSYMAAWNAHDAAKAAAFFADDGVYFDTTVGTPQKGRDAVRRNVIEVFMKAAPNLTWSRDAKAPIIGPEGIAFEWSFKGTNTGAWDANTPATNKPFEFKGVSFVMIKNGKIEYQGDYYDALSFQKQLGWIK
ncbi:MAG: SgcJ/EcaC family oxidoreductase [Elusimicrobia bacterium]|nr:SgcJ/EcaC family oxidoreductase [Elusimicrobiota bacterium]